MSTISRISISVEEDLLEKFDEISKRRGFPTRSEAVKHLMSSALVEQEWESGEIVAAVITIIYDHHKVSILRKIVDSQHRFGRIVICSQHAHLDHDHCMENIIVQGKVECVRKLHRLLSSIKGMKHTVLSMTTSGRNLDGTDDH